MAHEYGEGVLRIDKATAYLIKAARFCKTKWSMTDEAVMLALMRALYAETLGKDKPSAYDSKTNQFGTHPTSFVVRPKP